MTPHQEEISREFVLSAVACGFCGEENSKISQKESLFGITKPPQILFRMFLNAWQKFTNEGARTFHQRKLILYRKKEECCRQGTESEIYMLHRNKRQHDLNPSAQRESIKAQSKMGIAKTTGEDYRWFLETADVVGENII